MSQVLEATATSESISSQVRPVEIPHAAVRLPQPNLRTGSRMGIIGVELLAKATMCAVAIALLAGITAALFAS